ncbi:MAG: cation:proton antiporter [Chloroflexota bacterium]
MSLVLVYAVTLQLAVLVSELARRSVLSTAVIFLVAGFLAGQGVFNFIPENPDDPIVSLIAELALFSVLYTDGMRAPVRDLVSAWRLPGRALLLGLPLALLGTALLARYIVGLSWAESILIGAALSPTDPVFAAAIVGREEIPSRLRFLLNVESGLNDGLALPIVLVMLAIVSGASLHPGTLIAELVLGIIIGIAIPWLVIALERTPVFAVAAGYQPLGGFAVGLLVFATASITQGNLFLAAFAAGITVASLSPRTVEDFHGFGELVTELLKLAAILVFGALISPAFLAQTPLSGYAFAILTILAVRPAALAIALFRSGLSLREWLVAAWFGPKGFASVVYGLLILRDLAMGGVELFHLIALVITISIIAHSSSDVPIAHWFASTEHDHE